MSEAYIPEMYVVGMTSAQKELVWLFRDHLNMLEVYTDDNIYGGYARSVAFWVSAMRELEEIR
jgi:hypothetical protein